MTVACNILTKINYIHTLFRTEYGLGSVCLLFVYWFKDIRPHYSSRRIHNQNILVLSIKGPLIVYGAAKYCAGYIRRESPFPVVIRFYPLFRTIGKGQLHHSCKLRHSSERCCITHLKGVYSPPTFPYNDTYFVPAMP